MNYTTQQDVLDFVEDNNVKFVRFAFTDIFGTQKNIAVLASDLPKALEDGVCFDGSSVPGFMHVEESDLVLRPDLSTITILPWRPAEGRVMQFFCDIQRPDGAPFGGNCRGFLRQIAQQFRRLGLVCNVGAECEFYLFETDDRGQPTRIPMDRGGYFDVYPLDAAENLRRDICLTMEQMGLAPQHSHHESGNGQNEIDFHHASPLKTADNVMMFKQITRAVAGRNGLHASFMPKPLADQAGSGLHVNISLYRDRKNLFEGDIAPDSREWRLRLKYPREYERLRKVLYPQMRAVDFRFNLHRRGMQQDTVYTTEVDSNYMRGMELLKKRNYEAALTILRPYEDRNTALAYLSLGYNEAAFRILKSVPDGGSIADVQYMLAVVASRLGNEEQAVQYFLRSVELRQNLKFRGNLDPEISRLIRKYGLFREDFE